MEFQQEKESWDSYKERLDNFFTATGMEDDDKKVFTLIHQNGPSLFTLLKELSFPKNPTQMGYDEIIDILTRHYTGAKNLFKERKSFYCAQLRDNETASEWHRRLKALSIDCDFGGFLEEILVDKFVTGFRGKVLFRLYEQNENLSLQQALEIAQLHENTTTSENHQNNRSTSRSRQKQKDKQQENKPHDEHHQKQQLQQNEQKQQGERQQTQKREVVVPAGQEQQRPARKNVPSCSKCGKQGHHANVCRSQTAVKAAEVEYVHVETERKVVTCFKCGKQGHYANVCRSQTAVKAAEVEYVHVETERRVLTCYKCGQRGHYANVCPTRRDEGCRIS